MADFVLKNVDQIVIDRLSQRASRAGRTLEDEVKSILEQASRKDMAKCREAADRMRAKVAGRQHTDSAILLAEDRER